MYSPYETVTSRPLKEVVTIWTKKKPMMRLPPPSEKLTLSIKGILIPLLHDIIGYILNKESKNIMDGHLFSIEELDTWICL